MSLSVLKDYHCGIQTGKQDCSRLVPLNERVRGTLMVCLNLFRALRQTV